MNISERVASELADSLCEKISRKVIKLLQSRKDLLFGDNSVLENTWDEICVQVQGDQSFYWDAYDRMVCDSITGYLEDLKLYECVAISIKKNNDNYWADDGACK